MSGTAKGELPRCSDEGCAICADPTRNRRLLYEAATHYVVEPGQTAEEMENIAQRLGGSVIGPTSILVPARTRHL